MRNRNEINKGNFCKAGCGGSARIKGLCVNCYQLKRYRMEKSLKLVSSNVKIVSSEAVQTRYEKMMA